jgi:hypothetical protein
VIQEIVGLQTNWQFWPFLAFSIAILLNSRIVSVWRKQYTCINAPVRRSIANTCEYVDPLCIERMQSWLIPWPGTNTLTTISTVEQGKREQRTNPDHCQIRPHDSCQLLEVKHNSSSNSISELVSIFTSQKCIRLNSTAMQGTWKSKIDCTCLLTFAKTFSQGGIHPEQFELNIQEKPKSNHAHRIA